MKSKFLIYSLLLYAFIAFPGDGEFLINDAFAKNPCNKIVIDGKKRDWNHQPVLVQAKNNKLDYFPAEVGAAIADRVDVRQVKAVMDAKKDIFYFYIRFWGGPVWPNYAYQGEFEGQEVERHRGYYHLLLDLDNDPSTGWDSRFYEGHYTPLGYYASQGDCNSNHLGAECYIDLEIDSYWTPPAQSGEPKYVSYGASDMHDYDGITGAGGYHDMYYFDVVDPQIEDMAKFVGMTLGWPDGEEHWAGHAFGNKFLEYGVSLDVFRAYWASQGQDYLQPGDVIGISAFIETPIDDWGIDMSPRGFVCVPRAYHCKGDKTCENEAGFEQASIPTEFGLNENYPNPFNPETEIRFQLPEESHVIIRVYNSLGQEIKKLTDTRYDVGYHNVQWNGTDQNGYQVSSGVYVYSIQAGTFQQMKKMILIK